MTSTEIQIDFAKPADLPELTEIYNHYVLNTAFTFDTTPFSAADRKTWLTQFEPASIHQCLVAKRNNDILGYASSSKLRPKPAYNSSVETTIYLRPDAGGDGLGSRLYQTLLTNLENLGVHRVYGIVALPNEASMHLHQQHGFVQIGVLNEVGYKFGQFHDTAWLEKRLEKKLEKKLHQTTANE
ncbi:MAG: phosphinothricin acetyltransferase [Candidatus Azotimanducaceae bacterium]|jgi:phosphinothricin acetyltransferase